MMVEVTKHYNEELAFIICYPYPSKEEYSERVAELIQLGVNRIELVGPVRLGKARILGKGYRGIVVKAYKRGKFYALKIRRVDAERDSLEREAFYIRVANGVNVGPIVYGYTRNFILMEYIEGINLPLWVMKAETNALRKTIATLLSQAFALDMIGLDHGELARPVRNVLIKQDGKPVIIDFESASLARRPRNLTRLTQYLFIRRNKVSTYIESKMGKWDRKELLKALKEYKRTPSRRTFSHILGILKLT